MSELDSKREVHDFWNQASCGEALYLTDQDQASFNTHLQMRYSLEPFILDFAKFSQTKALKVLEIGVGLGADHQMFAQADAQLYGIDLTERAIENTRMRLACFNL